MNLKIIGLGLGLYALSQIERKNQMDLSDYMEKKRDFNRGFEELKLDIKSQSMLGKAKKPKQKKGRWKRKPTSPNHQAKYSITFSKYLKNWKDDPDSRQDWFDKNTAELKDYEKLIPDDFLFQKKFGPDGTIDNPAELGTYEITYLFYPKKLADAIELHQFLLDEEKKSWMEDVTHTFRYE